MWDGGSKHRQSETLQESESRRATILKVSAEPATLYTAGGGTPPPSPPIHDVQTLPQRANLAHCQDHDGALDERKAPL